MKALYYLAGLAFMATSASAQSYCHYPPQAKFVEGTNERIWRMTSNKARKVKNAAQKKPSATCKVNFHNLGEFIQPIEITRKPTLNRAAAGVTYLTYWPEKSGSDTMTIKVRYLNRSNRAMESVINYQIEVVDHEL